MDSLHPPLISDPMPLVEPTASLLWLSAHWPAAAKSVPTGQVPTDQVPTESASIGRPPIAPNPPSRLSQAVLNPRTGAIAGAAIAAIAGTSLLPPAAAPQYEGKIQLRVAPPSRVSLKPATKPAKSSAALTKAALTKPSVDEATQLQVLWSPKLLTPVVQQLQQQYPKLDYSTLRQQLKIRYRQGGSALEVRYSGADPNQVQAVLQRLSQAYLIYGQTCKTGSCRELAFVEAQLPTLQRQVALAEKTLQTVRQAHGLIDAESLGQQLSARSDALAQQQQQLQIRQAETQRLYQVLQTQQALPSDRSLAERLLSQNPRYQALLGQYQTIAQQLAVEFARPQTQPATIQALQQRYQSLSAQMAQAVQQPFIDRARQASSPSTNASSPQDSSYQHAARLETLREWVVAASQLQVLAVSRGAIDQAQGLLKQQIQRWAAIARQDADLQREVQLSKTLLNQYLTQRDGLLRSAAPSQPWQIMAPPEVIQVEPSQPLQSLSETQREVGFGLLLSFMLVLGILTAFNEAHAANPSIRLGQPLESDAEATTVLTPTALTQESRIDPMQLSSLEAARIVLFLVMVVARSESSRSPRSLSPGVEPMSLTPSR